MNDLTDLLNPSLSILQTGTRIMFIRFFVLIVLLILISGCANPPRPAFMNYSKLGVDELEVKKAMLECGSGSINPNKYSNEALGLSGRDQTDERINHHMLVQLCMDRDGFKYRHGTVEAACSLASRREKPAYTACQPNPPIPERSIETRLNSHHCKVLSVTPAYCLP